MTRDVNDVMHRKRTRRILGDLKKSVELSSWLGRRLTFACSPKPGQWPCGGCHTCWWGADGKAGIERLCLSPYVEKPFNSKVIKSFVPELKHRKRFSCFGIPLFYVYMLRKFYVRFAYSCMTMLQIFYKKKPPKKQTNKQPKPLLFDSQTFWVQIN